MAPRHLDRTVAIGCPPARSGDVLFGHQPCSTCRGRPHHLDLSFHQQSAVVWKAAADKAASYKGGIGESWVWAPPRCRSAGVLNRARFTATSKKTGGRPFVLTAEPTATRNTL
jgi:hypothetical protein